MKFDANCPGRFLLFSLCFALWLFPLWSHAQTIPHAIVKGRVIDDSTGAPLPLTNVFIANSTIGAAADAEGRFILKFVPLGTQQVVASIVGYRLETWTLRLTDTISYEVEFRLRPRAVLMPGVLVEEKDPVEWKKNLQRFLDSFLGSTPNAGRCRLINPEVLDFQVDEKNDRLMAAARSPLVIENSGLGYRFLYILHRFVESPQQFQFVGVAHFVELQPKDGQETANWKENRRKTYFGSRRHFLAALIKKTWREEGFEVNTIRKTPPKMALMWKSGHEVDADTLLRPAAASYERKLSFEGIMQVVYTKGRRQQISLMELEQPVVTIYTNGLMENPLKMITQGYWSTQRVADLLPTDYEPE